jgi:pSer/pThr/pTyr-binding forkhead associated (FHA) protein
MGRRKRRSPRSVPATSDQLRGQEGSRRLIVGRGKGCDIHLDDAAASRRHCVVIISEDAITIADLGSKNGTHVNDKRIGEEEVRLRRGDVVTIGQTVLLLPKDVG